MGYFARLFTLLFSILFSLFLVWFGLKSYGESLPASEFETELVKKLRSHEKPIVWQSWQSTPPPQFAHINAHFSKNLWLTRLEKDSLPLDNALKNLPSTSYILLHIDVKSPQALPALRSKMKEMNIWSRIVFCSRSDGILKDLRALEPEWTFCSGEIFMTRMLGLSSLGLQSLNRISADIFFIHLNQLKLKRDLLPLIKEAQRQNRLTFVGPVPQTSSTYPVDAWVIKN